MNGPQISWLPDGRRLHMNHGPIDLIVEAWGETDEVRLAYEQAAARFRTILTELVAELPDLRKPARAGEVPPPRTPPLKGEGCVSRRASPATPAEKRGCDVANSPSPLRGGVRGGGKLPGREDVSFTGPTARRMAAAVGTFAADAFITPMAAVAGAVADEMMAAMIAGRRLEKAYVNDGGDIALHLSEGTSLTLAVAGTGHGFADRLTIDHDAAVRGVATSGWRGRSFSLGIADAVTVLARNAATADAAATLIANAVDLAGHPAVIRTPANTLQPDTDLGDRPVTTGVGTLTAAEIDLALSRGLAVAEDFRHRDLIKGAALFLAGEARVVGLPDMPRSTLPPSGLPAISPSRGEIKRCTGGAYPPLPVVGRNDGDWLISPLEGEMAGRPEGGAKGRHPATEYSLPIRKVAHA